jgi:hypothetical protein
MTLPLFCLVTASEVTFTRTFVGQLTPQPGARLFWTYWGVERPKKSRNTFG